MLSNPLQMTFVMLGQNAVGIERDIHIELKIDQKNKS